MFCYRIKNWTHRTVLKWMNEPNVKNLSHFSFSYLINYEWKGLAVDAVVILGASQWVGVDAVVSQWGKQTTKNCHQPSNDLFINVSYIFTNCYRTMDKSFRVESFLEISPIGATGSFDLRRCRLSRMSQAKWQSQSIGSRLNKKIFKGFAEKEDASFYFLYLRICLRNDPHCCCCSPRLNLTSIGKYSIGNWSTCYCQKTLVNSCLYAQKITLQMFKIRHVIKKRRKKCSDFVFR